MGLDPKDIERGKVRVRQLKTGKHMMIPIHAELAKTIAASSITDEVFVTTERGAAYQSDASFGNWFSNRCVDAGLKGFSMHGLRKAASWRMAEMGLSIQLIKSITGHTSDSEASRYTREAEQEAMADRAMEIMSLANFSK
ncbi:tyrosine-type recombinase/integrase [Altererythrobacter indicus]|uniref:Tyrosine-type recombinase/integrase n=1 Tax=Altericroceibacterium indicum TaxID=374177 RepID=A0A845A5H5_9SPHN|nr:tyrosine-type recombinase/integrase [Altericroceibacterium indicum]MXP24579.1 tyrosine-type recombinase/integrase [Altericroceibacterium indicum]